MQELATSVMLWDFSDFEYEPEAYFLAYVAKKAKKESSQRSTW